MKFTTWESGMNAISRDERDQLYFQGQFEQHLAKRGSVIRF